MSTNGRPSIYSEDLAADICLRLVEGESLRSICRDDDMPSKSTVLLWVAENREGFSDHYARARQAQAFGWADEILEIADDGINDTYVDDKGNERTDYDHISRSKLRVDTRKWMLSRMLPKLYGDRTSLVGPDGEGPVEIAVTRKVVKAPANRISEHVNGANANGRA